MCSSVQFMFDRLKHRMCETECAGYCFVQFTSQRLNHMGRKKKRTDATLYVTGSRLKWTDHIRTHNSIKLLYTVNVQYVEGEGNELYSVVSVLHGTVFALECTVHQLRVSVLSFTFKFGFQYHTLQSEGIIRTRIQFFNTHLFD